VFQKQHMRTSKKRYDGVYRRVGSAAILKKVR